MPLKVQIMLFLLLLFFFFFFFLFFFCFFCLFFVFFFFFFVFLLFFFLFFFFFFFLFCCCFFFVFCFVFFYCATLTVSTHNATFNDKEYSEMFELGKKMLTLLVLLRSKCTYRLAGLGGSVGCAVRLETRRSRVQPPPRSATFFRGD